MLVDRVWYERHQTVMEEVNHGRREINELLKQADVAAKEMREHYGPSFDVLLSDFEWGIINGKLSAIRWALLEEWDCLDT
jgi:hypothetical protein